MYTSLLHHKSNTNDLISQIQQLETSGYTWDLPKNTFIPSPTSTQLIVADYIYFSLQDIIMYLIIIS